MAQEVLLQSYFTAYFSARCRPARPARSGTPPGTGWVSYLLRDSHFRQGGAAVAPGDVRGDGQLEGRHPPQVHLVVLGLVGGPAGAERPHLPDHLADRLAVTRQPPEDELLGPGGGRLGEVQPDPADPPGLVEPQPD